MKPRYRPLRSERLRSCECSPPMTCYNGRHLGRSDQNGNNNFHVGTSGYLQERRKAEEEISRISVFWLSVRSGDSKNEWIWTLNTRQREREIIPLKLYVWTPAGSQEYKLFALHRAGPWCTWDVFRLTVTPHVSVFIPLSSRWDLKLRHHHHLLLLFVLIAATLRRGKLGGNFLKSQKYQIVHLSQSVLRGVSV